MGVVGKFGLQPVYESDPGASRLRGFPDGVGSHGMQFPVVVFVVWVQDF